MMNVHEVLEEESPDFGGSKKLSTLCAMVCSSHFDSRSERSTHERLWHCTKNRQASNGIGWRFLDVIALLLFLKKASPQKNFGLNHNHNGSCVGKIGGFHFSPHFFVHHHVSFGRYACARNYEGLLIWCKERRWESVAVGVSYSYPPGNCPITKIFPTFLVIGKMILLFPFGAMC